MREDFYEALTEFGMSLKTALSSRSFFEDRSVSESKIKRYKDDLRFFTSLRKIAKQDSQKTVDFSAYEDQIRKLVDRHVVGEEIKDADGVYLVNELDVDADSAKWSEEKTRNETDIIRSRIKKTIELELADDPYAQMYFSELLRQAIAEAKALFEHPFKQYELFKDFDKKVANHDVKGVPESITGNKHARAYFGILKLVVGPEDQSKISVDSMVDAALLIEEAVRTAVSEHSLNPQNIEAAIRQALLPKLFGLIGLDQAKDVIDRVIAVTRIGISRGDF